MEVYSPKGLIKAQNFLGQDTGDNFYLRVKDKFFENVSPGDKISMDAEDKNEEISIDDDGI